MSVAHRLLLCSVIFFVIGIYGCGGGGSNGSGGGGSDTVTVNGSIGEVIASGSQLSKKSFFISLLDKLSFTRELSAADEDFGDISIQVFDGETLVDETTSNQSGEFTLVVPCDTPLTLVFNNNGSQIELGGVVFPCTDQNTEVSIVLTLNFNDEQQTEFEIEEQDNGNNAFFACNGGSQILGTEDEDLIIEGDGDNCILTRGNCDLTIIGSNVEFNNCENCIDARGTSHVHTEITGDFNCDSSEDGIRTQGSSLVDVTVITTSESGGIFIDSGEDGVDSRGNSMVNLKVLDYIEDPSGRIVIDAGENALKSIGKAIIFLNSAVCDITGDTEIKGNSYVSVCE